MAGAYRSLAEFRMDAMKLTRDLLNWWTLIKHTPNKARSEKLENILKNDINTLNLITNGELRGSDERKVKLKSRLINKYTANTNKLINKYKKNINNNQITKNVNVMI